jgi:hypothetical protein
MLDRSLPRSMKLPFYDRQATEARQAHTRAFLAVPLFKAVCDKDRGAVLPPAAALERDMAGLGVGGKQKDRARRVLERSAQQLLMRLKSRSQKKRPPSEAAFQPTRTMDRLWRRRREINALTPYPTPKPPPKILNNTSSTSNMGHLWDYPKSFPPVVVIQAN